MDILRLLDEELAMWMPRFMMEIRNKDGGYYLPPPPEHIVLFSDGTSAPTVLHDGERSIDLLTNACFHQLCQVLNSKMTNLKKARYYWLEQLL